ncbi:hypothetical protein BpHYR1_011174, partial [Brachionus plicatilis]
MSLSILVDNGEALISFSCTFFEQRLRPDTEVTASSWSSTPLLLPSRNRYPYFCDERGLNIRPAGFEPSILCLHDYHTNHSAIHIAIDPISLFQILLYQTKLECPKITATKNFFYKKFACSVLRIALEFEQKQVLDEPNKDKKIEDHCNLSAKSTVLLRCKSETDTCPFDIAVSKLLDIQDKSRLISRKIFNFVILLAQNLFKFLGLVKNLDLTGRFEGIQIDRNSEHKILYMLITKINVNVLSEISNTRKAEEDRKNQLTEQYNAAITQEDIKSE